GDGAPRLSAVDRCATRESLISGDAACCFLTQLAAARIADYQLGVDSPPTVLPAMSLAGAHGKRFRVSFWTAARTTSREGAERYAIPLYCRGHIATRRPNRFRSARRPLLSNGFQRSNKTLTLSRFGAAARAKAPAVSICV